MIFVDAGVWVASVLETDRFHSVANEMIETAPEAIITTDYVVDEALTVLKARGAAGRARAIGEQLLVRSVCQVHWVTRDDVLRGWKIFATHTDKLWSFTDCVSLAIINLLGISVAMSFDHHFKQFGSVQVIPSNE